MSHNRPESAPLTPGQQQWLQHTIETAGWAIIFSAMDAVTVDVPFAYTVGLTEHDLPEMLITGVQEAIAGKLLNDLARRATGGNRFHHEQRISDLISNFDAIIVDGPADGLLRPTAAIYLYGPAAVRLQQCVWPDPSGRFPWESAYTMDPAAQPIIGRVAQP
ncbi:DUF4262 domain-containing protein [Hamadaea sp. NPDC050747]|uniref:DUF4262 domain-containing protein n=1 Tax=Hamadaea sp. NPDC050747 TaxID=3155789 RepID=UPI0033D77290